MALLGLALQLVVLFAAQMVLSAPQCLSPPTVALNLGPCRVLAVDKSDVSSFGITVGVQGTEICVAPSTTVNSTFLTEASICADNQLDMSSEESQKGVSMNLKQCRSRRGGFVDKNTLAPADVQGVKDLNPGWGIFGNKITAAASATLQLLDERVTDIVGLITEGQKSTQSHLALSSGSTLLRRLKESGLIGALSWGLNSGSQSVLFPRVGSLVLGGFDKGSLAGPFYDYQVSRLPLEGRYCPLQVLVTGLSVSMRTGNTTTEKEIVGKANKLPACVEPYDNLFRMPKNLLGQFKDLLKGTPVEPSAYADKLVNLEPGIVYRKDTADFNATLRFTINYNQTVEVPFYEVQRSLRGLDANGAVVVDPDYNELQIYGTPADGDAAVLGKAFLSQLYLYVNYESMSFHMASQKAEATTPLPEATDDSCSSSSTGLTAESKGLIAVGSVLGALLIALLLAAVFRWRKKRNATPPPGILEEPATPTRQESPHSSRTPSRGDTIFPPPFPATTSVRDLSTDSIFGGTQGRSSRTGRGSVASPQSHIT
ncbi:hypothetical protein QBC34DRAFT_150854 [Podospora aff. communis PSN243]|uniref:Peptidase A1 domain-containing protein n=1 Tax=Podospora aff. communis PSN243 TaxID=3040156 RepID=A0AAV9GGY5_9PEZI|nr:hypothetical protein QBC34DRAFT_150854 [Podospora aff. communis PSN243]